MEMGSCRNYAEKMNFFMAKGHSPTVICLTENKHKVHLLYIRQMFLSLNEEHRKLLPIFKSFVGFFQPNWHTEF